MVIVLLPFGNSKLCQEAGGHKGALCEKGFSRSRAIEIAGSIHNQAIKWSRTVVPIKIGQRRD